MLFFWVFSGYNLLGNIALLQTTSVRSLISDIYFSCEILQGNSTFRDARKLLTEALTQKYRSSHLAEFCKIGDFETFA